MKRLTPRLTLVLGVLSVVQGGAALAYDSKCYVQADPAAPDDAQNEPACAAGPQAARNRWIGELDEHRQLFEATRALAGLPAEVSEAAVLRVFTGADPVDVAGASQDSLAPVPFDEATRVQIRRVAAGELSQLPDFSFALWDWATGNETCPLPEVDANAQDCHDFASHMGAVNSNHFLPQAGEFYARTHALAVSRAEACGTMRSAVGDDGALRFAPYLRACVHQALSLEAFAQHYLQDAWSMGHMWPRWGSPDLGDFRDEEGEVDRQRAVLVALSAGVIHGARGVLQDAVPAWAGADVNDAMCAPRDGVGYRDASDGTAPGLGDLYLDRLGDPEFAGQWTAAFACFASGLAQVYDAVGADPPDGPRVAFDPRLSAVDPTGEACLGQRATNLAIHVGMGVDLRLAPFPGAPFGAPIHIQMDGRLLTTTLVTLSQQYGGGQPLLPSSLSARYRVDMARVATSARLWAEYFPDWTDFAEGELGPLLGIEPNDAYTGKSPLAGYVDPNLPWPSTADDVTPDAEARAHALARVFHRAHSADWCTLIDADALTSLSARAGDEGLPADERAAACEACAEFTVRHLRVGTNEADYDTDAEPLCHFLADAPAYVYHPARGEADTTSLARSVCGCGEAIVLTGEGVGRIQFAGDAVTRLAPDAWLAGGGSPRDLAVTGADGGRAVVTHMSEGTLSVVSLARGDERELDLDGDPDNGVTRLNLGGGPRGVAVTQGGGYAVVALGDSDEVAIVDLADFSLCKRFDVGRDAAVLEIPEDVVISRDNLTAYVSLTGSPAQPGEAVAIIDMLDALDCASRGGEVDGYLDDLGGDPRPGELALSPQGDRLAVAGRGNNRVAIVDTATRQTLDLMPDDPARRLFLAEQLPWALAWSQDASTLWMGGISGPAGSDLDGYGAIHYGHLVDGDTDYAVGVRGAVRALVLAEDERWLYVGDSEGNLTALSVDLWDFSQAHLLPPFDGTGGCLDERGDTTFCNPVVDLGDSVRDLIAY